MAERSQAYGDASVEDAYARTREIALRALDRRAYARAELASYLSGKGADDTAVEQVLCRLEELGLIDDDAFAEQWVDSRRRGRLLSRRALANELRRKGIAEELIVKTLDAADGPDDEDLALEFARRKAGSMKGLDRQVAVRRLAGALARRGYSGEMVWSAAKQAVDELSDDDVRRGF